MGSTQVSPSLLTSLRILPLPLRHPRPPAPNHKHPAPPSSPSSSLSSPSSSPSPSSSCSAAAAAASAPYPTCTLPLHAGSADSKPVCPSTISPLPPPPPRAAAARSLGRGTARNRPSSGDASEGYRTFWARSEPCWKEKKEGIVGVGAGARPSWDCREDEARRWFLLWWWLLLLPAAGWARGWKGVSPHCACPAPHGSRGGGRLWEAPIQLRILFLVMYVGIANHGSLVCRVPSQRVRAARGATRLMDA